MSHYRINVSLNGEHYFATAPESITTDTKLLMVYSEFQKKFPDSEGYTISVTYWAVVGHGVSIAFDGDTAIVKNSYYGKR